MNIEWINVENKPTLNSRCLVMYLDGYCIICNYKIDKVWGRGEIPVFLDEQDEQPGVHYPNYYILMENLTLLKRS